MLDNSVLDRFKTFWQTVMLAPFVRLFIRLGISPDAVTLVGTLGVSAGALVFFPQGMLWQGVLVITAFVFSDLVDGQMARTIGRTDTFGAFLDSTLDRVSDGMLFAALAWNQAVGGSRIGLALALGTGLLAFLTSYIRAKAESLDLTCNVGIAERTVRLAFVGVGLAFHVLLPALGLLFVLSLVTVVHRFSHVFRKAQAPL